MTTSLTLTVTPSNPAPGATLTGTYAFVGAPADRDITFSGTATLDGVVYNDTEVAHLTHQTTFSAPTAAGVTFAATADPKVWTATAPAS